MKRARSDLVGSALITLIGASLACGLIPPGTPTAGPEPAAPTDTPAPPEPTQVPYSEVVVTHRGPEFRLYTLDGTLLETRSAEGMDWARPNTAQVVGDDIFYVHNGGPATGSVVRRLSAAGSQDLAFASAPGIDSLTFTVSGDGSRIAWTTSSWAAGPPFSRLWTAGIDGAGATLVTETDPADAIAEYYVLEAVEWLDDGDLVYAWQISGIGGYILFFGWSSLYRFDLGSGTTTGLTGPLGEGSVPCWSDVTFDGAYALGACGGSAQMVERATASGVETLFPLFPDQGQAGAGIYTPSGDRLAYTIARGDTENEAGQLILVQARAAAATAIGSHAPGAFDHIEWLDEDRLVAGYWTLDQTFVDLFHLDGTRSLVGEGRLIGVIRR